MVWSHLPHWLRSTSLRLIPYSLGKWHLPGVLLLLGTEGVPSLLRSDSWQSSSPCGFYLLWHLTYGALCSWVFPTPRPHPVFSQWDFKSFKTKGHCFNFLFLFLWPLAVASEILVLEPGIKHVPPAVEAQSPSHWTTSEVPLLSFFVSVAFSFFSSSKCAWIFLPNPLRAKKAEWCWKWTWGKAYWDWAGRNLRNPVWLIQTMS